MQLQELELNPQKNLIEPLIILDKNKEVGIKITIDYNNNRNSNTIKHSNNSNNLFNSKKLANNT